jgi:general stress protein 26
MTEPRASRPHMPGYGVLGPTEGTGLLPWQWAEKRLSESRNYWVVTLWPDGRPHSMPVWGVWDRALFWFSSSLRSRKARNVAGDPRCVITTEDSLNPVTVEGMAELTRNGAEIARMLALINDKYATEYSLDFLDPDVNATICVRPRWAFGLAEEDFTGSPTRWSFDDADESQSR